jgi:hypothetical protein
MGISLTEKNRILTTVGGIQDAAFLFPSFIDLREPVRHHVGRPLVYDPAKMRFEDNEDERLVSLFDEHCLGAEGIKVRVDGKAVDIASVGDWKSRIPDITKAKVAKHIFGLQGSSSVEEAEALGDPTLVRLKTIFGEILFTFPEFDNADFQKALKAMLGDHSRPRGDRLLFMNHAARMKFFKEQCLGVGGIDGLSGLDQVPENWAAGACVAFVQQEVLSEIDLGN